MKKTFITLILIGLCAYLPAQTTDHIHNIQANVGGGIHTMNYKPVEGTHYIGMGGLFEIQYQYMLNNHLGFALGLQASNMRSSAKYTYGYTLDNIYLPGAYYPSNVNVQCISWRERQDVVNLGIPLQVLLRAPINVSSTLQLGLGASLNFPLSAKYKTTDGRYNTEAYMPRTNITYADMPEHGLGTYRDSKQGSISLIPVFCALHADLGFDFNIGSSTGLYLGLYGYYSPADINGKNEQGQTQQLINYDPTNLNQIYTSTFASDRVGVVHPLEIGIKLGLRLGVGKEIGWQSILAAQEAAAAQAEAERLAAEKKAEEERLAAEERARQEAVARARAEAEAKAKAEADSIARVHAAELAKAKAKAEAEAQEAAQKRAQAEAVAAALARQNAVNDSIARAKAEAEARLQAEVEARMRAEAEAEARIKAEAEARVRAEAEARARAKAEQRAREEAAFVAGYKDIAYFETGKDMPSFGELNENSWENLKIVMDRHPEIIVTVTGHTDNVGNANSNLVLSQKRADNIKKMLVNKGIDPNRIYAIGRGDREPIATNQTKEGRARNRRIEITIGKR